MTKLYNTPKSILILIIFFACSNNDKMGEVKTENVGSEQGAGFMVYDSSSSYIDSVAISNETYFTKYINLISEVKFDTIIFLGALMNTNCFKT